MEPVKLPGQFSGTSVYVFGDQTYHKDKRAKNPTYRCTYRRTHYNCSVTVKKRGKSYGPKPTTHNHPNPTNIEKKKLLKERIENTTAETHLTAMEIFEQLRER